MTHHQKISEFHFRSFAKALSWRILASISTVIISFVITHSVNYAMAIGGIEVLIKIMLYYVHERIWAKVPIGQRVVSESEKLGSPL